MTDLPSSSQHNRRPGDLNLKLQNLALPLGNQRRKRQWKPKTREELRPTAPPSPHRFINPKFTRNTP